MENKRGSVRERVTKALEDRIVDGELAPGQRLIERELCEQMGVSRATLRESFRELASSGLIQITPHRGPTVATLTEAEIKEIYEVREAIECLAIRLFVERASDAEMRKVVDIVKKLRLHHESGKVQALLAAKDKFYDLVYAGAGNDLLRSQASGLRRRITRLRFLALFHEGRALASIMEVEAAIDAVVERRADYAVELWRDHIRHAATTALDGWQWTETSRRAISNGRRPALPSGGSGT